MSNGACTYFPEFHEVDVYQGSTSSSWVHQGALVWARTFAGEWLVMVVLGAENAPPEDMWCLDRWGFPPTNAQGVTAGTICRPSNELKPVFWECQHCRQVHRSADVYCDYSQPNQHRCSNAVCRGPLKIMPYAP